MSRLVLEVDLDRCVGCHSCVVACKEEKGTPVGLSLMRVEQVGPEGEFPQLSMYYLPIVCQQCERPVCASACPRGAITFGAHGVVSVDADRCTGCGDCVEACPYQAIFLDSVAGVARTCDLCASLLDTGRQPACVAACCAKALRVVEEDESRPTRAGTGAPPTRPTFTLGWSPDAGPRVRYILSRQLWRG